MNKLELGKVSARKTGSFNMKTTTKIVQRMNKKEVFSSIASEVQIFQNLEQKESFLFVLGALVSRLISLKKAAEILEIEPELFLQLLDLMGIEFSYLETEDIAIERSW